MIANPLQQPHLLALALSACTGTQMKSHGTLMREHADVFSKFTVRLPMSTTMEHTTFPCKNTLNQTKSVAGDDRRWAVCAYQVLRIFASSVYCKQPERMHGFRWRQHHCTHTACMDLDAIKEDLQAVNLPGIRWQLNDRVDDCGTHMYAFKWTDTMRQYTCFWSALEWQF